MHWSNRFFVVKLLRNEPKTLLDIHPTYVLKRPMVRVAADSKLCCPLASFRPRRIPNLASLIAVPYDANLTVHRVPTDMCHFVSVNTISAEYHIFYMRVPNAHHFICQRAIGWQGSGAIDDSRMPPVHQSGHSINAERRPTGRGLNRRCHQKPKGMVQDSCPPPFASRIALGQRDRQAVNSNR